MIPRKIRPMTNHIVTTMDRYEDVENKSALVDPTKIAGIVKDVQKVIAVGPHVRDVKIGDYVRICPDRYIKVKHNLSDDLMEDKEMEIKINFPVVDLEDGRYLFLFDSDVDYVIEEFGEEKKDNILYTPPTIIK